MWMMMMDAFFYYSTGVVILLGLGIFLVSLVILRIPVDEK